MFLQRLSSPIHTNEFQRCQHCQIKLACPETSVYIEPTKRDKHDGKTATAFGGTNPSSQRHRNASQNGDCSRVAEVFHSNELCFKRSQISEQNLVAQLLYAFCQLENIRPVLVVIVQISLKQCIGIGLNLHFQIFISDVLTFIGPDENFA